jgi:DNA repair exonuclease SbcCD ATPase subunit
MSKSDDDVRRDHESRLSGLQGQHETLRDLIRDLENLDKLEPWQERQLGELQNKLDGLEREMESIERHL